MSFPLRPPPPLPLPLFRCPRASGVRVCGFCVLAPGLLQPFVCVCMCLIAPSCLSLFLVGRQVGGKIVVRWTGKVREDSHCACVWAHSLTDFSCKNLTPAP